jgi:hypothetical protein
MAGQDTCAKCGAERAATAGTGGACAACGHDGPSPKKAGLPPQIKDPDVLAHVRALMKASPEKAEEPPASV